MDYSVQSSAYLTPKDLQNYVAIDENLVTTLLLTDEEIQNAVTKGEEEQKEDEEEKQPDKYSTNT